MEHDDLYCEAQYWIQYAIANGLEAWEDRKEELIRARGRAAVKELTDKMKEITEDRLLQEATK